MEGWMARHFTKHLTDRELLKRSMDTNHHTRHEFEAKCRISSEALPSERSGDPFALKFDLLNKQKNAETASEAPSEAPKASSAFCDECDSKGVRHLKNCPTQAFKSLKAEVSHA